MTVSRRSLAIEVTLCLLILCSGCATHRGPGATIPAGTSVAHISVPNPTVVMPGGTKHFASVP